jgi:hypothetical protein
VRRPTTIQPFDEKRIELQAGSPLHLRCDAAHDANLNPVYVWSLNGRPVDYSDHFQVRIHIENVSIFLKKYVLKYIFLGER